MTGLAPRADEVVRDAVDAFMDGRRLVDHDGETLLETKNSRYRVLDGVLFSAPDPTLHGAEFVGWLTDNERRVAVEIAWQPGVRAVFVDRKRGRHIIITSTIVEVSGAKLHSEEREIEPSYPYALQRRRTPVPAAMQEVATPLPAPAMVLPTSPAPLPASAAATPPIPAFPPAPLRPAPRGPAPEPAALITAATRPPPPPPRRAAVPPAIASAFNDARAALHAPPRPTARIAPAMSVPTRPLPFPSPPPRRNATPVPPAAPDLALAPPIAPAPLPFVPAPYAAVPAPYAAAPAPHTAAPTPIHDPDLYSTSPDSLPMIDAPEPLPSSPSSPSGPSNVPTFFAGPALPDEPSLLASSDVLDAVDPTDAYDTEEDIDDVEQTEPTSPPFLLERPATAAPPPPASQPGNEPFLLGRPVQRNAPLR